MYKYLIRQFLLGLVSGAICASLFLLPGKANQFFDTLQKVVVIIATIFTAYWTSKTFTYNPKREEVKEVSDLIHKFVQSLTRMQSEKSLYDSLSQNENLSLEFRNEWADKSQQIKIDAEVCKDFLSQKLLRSNYISAFDSLNLQTILPFKVDNIKTKEHFDELRNNLWHYDFKLRDDAFFTIADEVRKVKKYFGF